MRRTTKHGSSRRYTARTLIENLESRPLLPASPASGEAFLFNEAFYLRQNPDVAAAVDAGVFKSGWDHFVDRGWQECRTVSPWFDNDSYLSANPDVAAALSAHSLSSPFEHFVLFG